MAKILVVEDEMELREAIVEELSEEGHVTVEAGNGLEGLEKLSTEMPDLILSDITMPKMNGYQFFRSVKERHPEHAQTPFIFLSALSDREDELKGLRLGVDDYLRKPIDFDLLLARIELGLRQRRALAQQTPSPAQSPDIPNRDAETTVAKISDIAASNDGRVLAGKFETISLEAIKEKVDDRWSEMSDLIMTSAEAVIQDYLGPKDACNITPSQDFVVCFADLTDEQVYAKVGRIRDAIWDRLFGETDDEDLSQIDAQTHEVSLKVDDTSDGEIILNEINQIIDKEKMAATEANKKKLIQIYKYEDLFALTLLSSTGAPSKIKLLSFEQRYADLIRNLFDERRYDGAFLLDLQQLLFERLKENRNLSRTFSNAAMLLPIHFAMLRDQEVRDRLIELCDELKKSINVDLVIEIIESPNRIKLHKSTLKVLPVGRKLQFLEIRRSAQIDGIELGELRDLGIAIVSMRYENVVHHDEQSLQQCIKLLEQGGTKFCIKDVPEGKLLDAQNWKAHMYAMHK